MGILNTTEEASAPATPAAGRRTLYPKAAGWYDKNSAGTEVRLSNETDLAAKAALAGSASQAFSCSTLNGVPPKHTNDILNGQFRIAQAGTSFAAPATLAYDLDGWFNINVSAAVFTVAQATGSSTGNLCRTVTVTTADASIAAGDYVGQMQHIEGYNALKYLNNTFTVGFRVKSSVTGIHCLSFYNGTSSYIAEYTVNAANTWEYKTITVVGGTPALQSTTNIAGFSVRFNNLCGSTFHTTAGAWNTGNFLATANQVNDIATNGNVFAIEEVTLNLGTVAATDERSYADDLAMCRRYYFRDKATTVNYFFASGWTGGTTIMYAPFKFPVPMRTAPATIEQSGTATDYEVYTASSGPVACSAVPVFNTATALNGQVVFTVAAGLTTGQSGMARAATTSGYIGFSARL